MTIWDRIAAMVLGHPARVLAIALLLLVPPASAVVHSRLNYDVLQDLPSETDSVQGFADVARHFDKGEVSPVVVLLEMPKGTTVWEDANFRAVDALTVNLKKLGAVARVRSLPQPTGGQIRAEDLVGLGFSSNGTGELASLPDKLEEAANGLRQAGDGLVQIREGLRRIEARMPELSGGLDHARTGALEIRSGALALGEGVKAIRSGLETVRSSLASLADVADQATTLSLRAFNTLSADSMCMVDTACQSALSDIGTCYGLMSGRDPRTGEQAAEAKAKGYKGMGSSLREILAGVGKSQGGLDQVSTGLDRLATGAGKLADGLEAASPAVKELRSGVGRMLGGLEQIIPGLDQLRDGLASGAVKIRASGIVSAPTAGQDFSLTPALVNAVPKLKEQLGYFVGEDGRWTRMYVSLAEDAYSTRSLDAIGEIRSLAKLSLARTPLAGSEVLVTGTSAYFDDIRRVSGEDTKLIVAVVIIGVFIVLALLLRSLVAPAYLVATVLLSLMSTLGLTTLVFQGLLHRSGISWFIPTFLFVILVALGADYNIFLMSRIREEAGRSVTSVAVGEGLRFTGHVITSAGLILAGTFAALMAASLKSLAEMGFAVTVGVLLDTFIVRSLLVPSLAVLLGRHNWWPSSRSRSA